MLTYASFLHDGSEVDMHILDWENRYLQVSADTQVLSLPIQKPDVIVPVIELTLKK